MNNADREYFKLLALVLEKGRLKHNRTPTPTLGVFGAQCRYDLSEGFPLLTTKRLYWKGIVHELLWFLSGNTNIKALVDNSVTFWNKDAYRNYLKHHEIAYLHDGGAKPLTLEEFSEKLKTDGEFAEKWGELGFGTYGSMWRSFPYHQNKLDEHWNEYTVTGGVDQVSRIIRKLTSDTKDDNPDDRRMIVSAWHPKHADECVLPPCHTLFQFHTEELTFDERRELLYKKSLADAEKTGIPFEDDFIRKGDFEKHGIPTRRLNLQLYQRSADLFLGVPFNIASYALLLSMVAQVTNMVPGEFIHSFGDLHIYTNHLEQVKEQLQREPKDLPKLELNPDVKSIFDFKFEDIKLVGYEPHPTIRGEMST